MKIKKSFKYIISLFILIVLASCGDDQWSAMNGSGNNTLVLKLCSSEVQSRTEDGVEALNENVLNSLDCFFYLGTADENTDALFHRSFTGLTAEKEHTLTIVFTEEEMESLFGETPVTGATCKLYVIANRPTDMVWEEGKTSVSELKALTITSDSFTDNAMEANFVMDSNGTDVATLTVTNNSKNLAGEVSLYRAASKISLVITQVTDITEQDSEGNSITWTANPADMKLKFHRGVKKGTLDTDAVPYQVVANDYFDLNTAATERTFSVVANGYATDVPYYSYASDWSEDATDEAYFILIVPWKKSTESSYKSCYYQIPINTQTKKLVRNNHYKINLKVSRLGSFVEEEPVELTADSYIILDWTTQAVDVEIDVARFLAVENTHVVMNNINEIRIPYVTSHDVEIVQVTCTRPDLNDGSQETVTSGFTLNLDNDGNIYYKRELNNDFTSDSFDFVPYTIQFTLQHKDITSYFQMVTIVQYPAIYGERDVNTDYTNGGNTNGDKGFVFVNGYQGNSSSVSGNQDYFDNVSGLSGGGVTSNTMLVFTISSIQGTKYIVGDPREKDVNSSFIEETHRKNNNTYSIWANAPAVYGDSPRYLQYYYATDTSHERLKYASDENDTQSEIYVSDAAAAAAERTYNMLAPKFRISSGYGAISTTGERQYYHLMKKRCASYQEDGYPAGRWRLPTKAEFEFIIYLSDQGKIPTLFADGLDYWCAHGHGTPDNGTVEMGYKTNFGNSSYVSVRCVYDDWYWGSEPVLTTEEQKDVFTWGDKQR